MLSSDCSGCQIASSMLRICVGAMITYYSARYIIRCLDQESQLKKRAKAHAQYQLDKLNASLSSEQKVKPRHLNEHELMIASHLITPEDIDVSWEDIAGLDDVIREFRDSVIFPVLHRDVFSDSKLWRAPKGVLLHGPPGCGKTLIAKAMAKEGGMRFINVNVAMLTDKWYGESQKLASAVFSLAQKLQPCVVFIDEIDSFLRRRSFEDHEATAMMKTQFMQLWDGLATNNASAVIVVGATNRPQDLDAAILRRMPSQFHIEQPNVGQRLAILKLILKDAQVDETVNLMHLAHLTQAFSGSDLREMCRQAVVFRMREMMRKEAVDTNHNDGLSNCPSDAVLSTPVSICMEDLLRAHETMKRSRMQQPSDPLQEKST